MPDGLDESWYLGDGHRVTHRRDVRNMGSEQAWYEAQQVESQIEKDEQIYDEVMTRTGIVINMLGSHLRTLNMGTDGYDRTLATYKASRASKATRSDAMQDIESCIYGLIPASLWLASLRRQEYGLRYTLDCLNTNGGDESDITRVSTALRDVEDSAQENDDWVSKYIKVSCITRKALPQSTRR